MPRLAVPIQDLPTKLAIRGLSPQTARFEGGIPQGNFSRAMNGLPVSQKTWRQIAEVLERHPVKPNLADLATKEKV